MCVVGLVVVQRTAASDRTFSWMLGRKSGSMPCRSTLKSLPTPCGKIAKMHCAPSFASHLSNTLGFDLTTFRPMCSESAGEKG